MKGLVLFLSYLKLFTTVKMTVNVILSILLKLVLDKHKNNARNTSKHPNFDSE